VLGALNGSSIHAANDAAQAIWQDPDPALLRGVIRTLRHGRRVHNRVEAAYALRAMRGLGGTATLEWVLSNRSEKTQVRAFAAETLAHRHRRASHAVLLRNLKDPSREVRFWCAFALGQMRERRALPILNYLAANDHRVVNGWWAVSKEAADAVSEIKNKQAGRCIFCRS